MKEYTVTIGGIDHTVQLSDEDASRLGAEPVATKESAAPKNKARSAQSKG